MRATLRSAALGAAVILVGAVSASAGVITPSVQFILPGFSTGSVGPIGANPAPNNDNAAAQSPNAITYSVFFNSPGIIEVQYPVANSGGVTEYFINQAFFNNSGVTWTGFMFELGYGTGDNFVRAGDGPLDFDLSDADPAPVSSRFSLLTHQGQVILWSGGTVSSVAPSPFSFSIDVPDGIGSFTLRQTPITSAAVPEPGSAALVLSAGALLGLFLRKRAQS